MSRKVWVSGVGIVSPAGLTASATFDALLAGGRFVREIPISANQSSVGELHHQINCPVGRVNPIFHAKPPAGANNKTDPIARFISVAATEALAHANIGRESLAQMADRVAICIGTSKGSIMAFDQLTGLFQGQKDPDGACFQAFLPQSAAQSVAAMIGISGILHAPVAACATGAIAIIRAVQMIQDGDADLVLAGSADASIHPLWLGAFDRMGVLAKSHLTHGPAWACRPFDRDRTGFAVGEGAGVLVLESADSLRRRGGRAIASIGGFALGSDGGSLTALSAGPDALEYVIRRTCDAARCQTQDLACIHAHGTATPSNDRLEIQAIRACLGSAVRQIPIVSFKGAIGHLLGAAGSVEIALSILAARSGQTPGTSTLLKPDPEFATMHLPAQSVAISPGPILKTSLGFGGHLAAVVVLPVFNRPEIGTYKTD